MPLDSSGSHAGVYHHYSPRAGVAFPGNAVRWRPEFNGQGKRGGSAEDAGAKPREWDVEKLQELLISQGAELRKGSPGGPFGFHRGRRHAPALHGSLGRPGSRRGGRT